MMKQTGTLSLGKMKEATVETRTYRVILTIDIEIDQHEDSADWDTVEEELEDSSLWDANHDLNIGWTEDARIESFVAEDY